MDKDEFIEQIQKENSQLKEKVKELQQNIENLENQ